jgi:hypothetical protein
MLILGERRFEATRGRVAGLKTECGNLAHGVASKDLFAFL